MRAFLKGLYMFGLSILISSCAKSVDYATMTGKAMFPYHAVQMYKVKITSVDPKTLKLKGFDDIRMYKYSVPVSSSYTARGYLLKSAKGAQKSIDLILFGHWLGGIQNYDSSEWEFFAEAGEYAREGNVCVIPSGNYPWMTAPSGTDKDVGLTIAQVNDYRIGLDILCSCSKNQSPKVLLIAHDYGAMFGILTAAADKRICAAVIMAPVSRFYQWNRILKPIHDGPAMDTYQAAMSPYDPVSLIDKLSIPLLFQYANYDRYVNKSDADSLINAASSAVKEVRWYPTSHNLTSFPEASADRKTWCKNVFTSWDSQASGQ